MRDTGRGGGRILWARTVVAVLSLAVVLFFPALSPCAGVLIHLKPTAETEGDQVRLGEIARIQAPSSSLRDQLGRIAIAQSPLPGQTRFVGLDFIRIRLKQQGIDLGAVRFDGQKEVSVLRKSAALPAAQIRQEVEAQIRNRMPWRREEVVISDISFDEGVLLPTGRLTYRVVPNRNEDYLGRILLSLDLFVNGKPAKKIWVQATISVTAEVVTVIRPLGKHQYVEPEDVALQRRDLAKLPSDAIRTVQEALGKRTTRMIYPDTVLQSAMIATPPLVKRGDVVKIVARSGPMTITATGKIKQRGRKGDMVKVVNTDSNRIITARVTGPGTVTVEF